MKTRVLFSLFAFLFTAAAVTAQTTTTYATNDNPFHTLLADVDNDGDLDVATFGTGSQYVSVRLNNGDGSYGTAAEYGVGSGLHVKSGAFGDINGDGFVDLIVANNLLADNLTPMLNDGDGTFTVGTNFAATVSFYPDFVGLADLDGDGDLDLMVSSQFAYNPNPPGNTPNNYVAGRMLNNGSGVFSGLNLWQVGTQPVSMTAADVDGDGDRDIAVANMNSDNLTLIFNNGSGGAAWVETISSGLDSPRRIGFADLDGGGKLDMYVANHDDSNVVKFNNTGSTTPSLVYFVSPDFFDTGANSFPQYVAFDDVNGDTYTDLIVSGANIYTLLNNGSGGLGAPTTINVGHSPTGFATGDIRGSGMTDYAATNLASDLLTIYLSAVAPTVTTTAATSVTTTGATLNGTINAEGSSTTAEFDYKLASAGSYSNTVTATPSPVTGSITTDISYALTGLLPNTEYDFRAAGTNAGGERLGTELSFTTSAAAPLVTTGAASNVSGTTVTLNGTVNAQNADATAYFEFGTTSGVYTSQVNVSGTINDGMDAVDVSENLTGLTIGETYYFRLVSENAGGTTTGSEGSFTTAVPALTFSSSSPAANAIDVARSANIDVTFSEAVKDVTVNSATFVVSGSFTGIKQGVITVNGAVATFNPSDDFLPGEVITVLLTENIASDAYEANLQADRVITFQAASDEVLDVAFNTANYATGSNPHEIATGDLNGDGYLDLVSVNQAANTLSVNLSNGNGTFAAATTLATNSFPQGIRLGDMDGDGDLDIVLTHISGGAGTVQYLNNGSGSFGSLSAILLNDGQDIELIDWDGDGDLDILGSTYITLIANNGDATYQTISNYGSGGTGYFLTKADVNNDGRMDLIASDYGSNVVRMYRNDANGHFYALSSLAAGTNPVGIKAADFNADGNIDIVVANYGSESIGVYLGNGNGTFASAVTYSVTGGPYDVDVADIDGDGDVDVAVSMQVGDGVNVYLNNGSGTLGTPEFFAGGNNPRGIVAADFNGDGKIDLATANNFGNNITVMRTVIPVPAVTAVSPDPNTVDASASGNITLTFNAPMSPASLTASNLRVVGSVGGIYSGVISSNGNTVVFNPDDSFRAGELVQVTLGEGLQNLEGVAMANPYMYSFLVGGIAGDAEFRSDIPISISYNSHERTEFVDIDNDGDVDIVGFEYGGNVMVRKNNGDGTYAAANGYYIGSGLLNDGVLVDIDNDGDLDVVSAHYQIARIGILLNNGSGVFSDQKTFTGNGATAIVSFDVNTDGFSDAIVTNQDDGTIRVHLHNQYTNQFVGFGSPNQTLAAGIAPNALVAADLNGDGFPDVVATNSGSANVSVFLNTGSGSFAAAVNYTVGTTPSETALADVDGNGSLDLLVSNSGSDDVSVLLNSGTGTFGTAATYAAGDAPSAISASDVDGDGSVDILVANFNSDNVSLLMNEGDGTFAAAVTYGAADEPIDVHGFDADGDGDVDVLTSHRAGATVTVLKQLGGPSVVSVTPTAFSVGVDESANITVTFNEAMDAASLSSSSINVRGVLGGLYAGAVTYDANVATFNPTTTFLPGDKITVTVTTQVENADNENLETPYSWTFNTESAAGSVSFIRADYNGYNVVGGAVPVDMDGDGDLDLVVTQTTAGYVSVVDNVGSGSFGSAQNYSVGTNPITVRVSDLNNDGLNDISVVNTGNDNVSVLINNGTGGFATAVNYAVQSGPYKLQQADLNGDGYMDLVTYNSNSGSFSVLMNDGDGTFAAAVNYTGYIYHYGTQLELADMNGDGALDVVLMASYTDYGEYNQSITRIQIVNNLGQGAFSGGTNQIIPGLNVTNLHLADLNADGRLDIAMTHDGNDEVRIYLRNVDGTYPSTASSSFSVVWGPVELTAADLDGDGDLDIASAGSGGELSYALNNGDGSFSESVGMSVNHDPNVIFAADVSGDGKLDLVMGHSNGFNVLGPLPAPTTSASNISFNNDVGTRVNMQWSNGNGTNRIVIVKQGSAVDFVPVDNTSYTANLYFGQGTELGTGNYVIANTTSSYQTSTGLYGLQLGTEYHVAIYEYNLEGGAIKYRTISPATASYTTATSPSGQAEFVSVLTDYGRQFTAQFAPGNGSSRIVLMKEGAPVDAVPSNNTTYAANSKFGLGAQIGTGNFVVFNGTQYYPEITLSGVMEGTTYHFAVFEYNGDPGSEAYNTASGNTGQHTTTAEAGFPFDEEAGHAARFTGQSAEYSYATLSDQITLGDAFSTEMWVKTDSIGTAMTFFSVGGSLDMLSLGLNATGQFTASVADTTTSSMVTVTGTTTAVKNGLYHVAMTAESNGFVRLYVNGTQEASAAINELLMEGEDSYPTLGAKGEIYGSSEEDPGSPDSEHFVGVIDELRIWNRVRTASEIRNERRVVPIEFPTDMVGYWQFNDEEEVEYSYDMYLIQSDFSYLTFVKSPAPFGGIASVSSAVTTGSVTLGGLQLNLTDGFDNPVDVHLSEITGDPNRFPAGYSSSTGDKVFLVELFGEPGTFSADLTLTFGSGVVTAEQETDPSLLKLFKRGSNDTGTWTDLGGASSAVAATGVATWTGITSFSQFVVVSDANLAPPVQLWRIADGFVNVYKPNYADYESEEFQDRITENVWLTRANNRGLFNIAVESSYDNEVNTAPAGTQWAYGTIDDLENLTFDTWYNAIWDDFGASDLYDIVGETFVMYIEEDNIYMEVKFTGWTPNSNGGGFSYGRGSGEATVPVDYEILAGNALSFDGVDDYMAFELDDILPRFPLDVTFEMWVKPAAIPASGESMVFASGDDDNYKIGLDSDGHFFADFYDNDYRLITGTTVANVGQWYHIAATVDGNDSLKLFVNGVQEASTTFGETYESIYRFIFGRADYYSTSYFQGELDEIRIWTVARTQSEISENMSNPNSGASGLNAFAVWQLNEGTGTTVTDAIFGREIDLTYAEGGQPTWVTSTLQLGPSDITEIESLDITAFSGSTYAFDAGLFEIDAYFGDDTFTLTADRTLVGTLFVDMNDNEVYDAGTDDILTDASSAAYTPSDLDARLRYTTSTKGLETVIVTFTSGTVSSDVELRITTVEAYPTLAGVAGEAGWYLLSNPLNTPLGTMLESIWTQGAVNSDAPSADATLYTYNQTTSEYEPVTTDLNTTTLPAGTGLLTYIFAFDDYATGIPEGGGWPKTLTNEGNPFGSNASILLRNVDGDDDDMTSGLEGFALLGNPFGWALSADSVIATLKRADPLANSYVYRWNAVTRRYQLLTTGSINAYEAVFVRLISSGIERTVEFDYNDGRNVIAPSKAVDEAPAMLPFLLTAVGQDLTSEMHLRFGKDGSAGIDPYDGYYLGTYASKFANLYMDNADQSLVINNLPESLDRALSVPVRLHASVAGEFELSWDQAMLPEGWSFVLEHTATGARVNLGEATSFRFDSQRLAKSAAGATGSVPRVQGEAPTFLLHIVPANVTSVDERDAMPTQVELSQNYPNPFNPSTQIRYGVPSQSAVTLEVFDILGRQVATLVNNQVMPAGRHSVSFDAGRLASGVYVYRLVVGEKVMTKRMVLIK